MSRDALPSQLASPLRLEQLVAPGSICRASDIAERVAAFPVYRVGMEWIRNVIMQPNAALQRPGAVCPFVALSMAQDALIFAVRPGASGAAQDAFDLMAPFVEIFRRLEPVSGPFMALKALTIFFPDLPEADWADFIDGGHRLLKPLFVEHGLMLGEFHPHSTKPGATNPAYHAMRGPVPAFVIREMAMHDTKFINNPDEAPERRAQYLRSWLEHVGPEVPRKVRENAERMLAGVDAELRAARG
jgi:hypothetical protein